MRIARTLRRGIALVAILALGLPGCAALRDEDGFITTIVRLSIDHDTGKIVVTPPVVEGDWSYGQIQINNATGVNHGFAIDELAIYAEIARDTAPIIGISDARDDHTYVFYCHLHDPKGQEGAEYRGELKIDYRTEERL